MKWLLGPRHQIYYGEQKHGPYSYETFILVGKADNKYLNP